MRRFLLCALLLSGCGSQAQISPAPPATAAPTSTQLTVRGFKSVSAQFVRVSREGLAVLEVPVASGDTVVVPLPGSASSATVVELLDAQRVTISHWVAGTELALDARVFHNGAPPAQPQPFTAQWQQVLDVPVTPDLNETEWFTPVAPFGPFDYIGLHRLRNTASRGNGKVVLFLPGATANGELYTTSEESDFRVYLANRGYDVYSLDYRTHFIPLLGLDDDLQPLDLSSLNQWDSSRFVSDVQLAVELAEATSGVSTLYLAAFSSGNEFMYFYSALFGREELRGLIGLDGGPYQTGSLAAPQTVDFARGLAALLGGESPANRSLLESWNVPPGAGLQFAAGNLLPDLSTLPPYTGGDDPVTFLLQNLWGYGQLTNIENGYNSLLTLLPFMLVATDDFWPNIQTLEDVTLSNWSGKPPTLRYLDNFGQVDLPMILFAAGMMTSFDYTRPEWKFLATTLTRTSDYETHVLEGFGHLDTLTGTLASEKVFEPMERWLRQHP